MDKINPSTLGTSHAAVKSPEVDNAKLPSPVQTPVGTLNITLSSAPTPSVPLYQNVSLWAGVITFLGVILSLVAAERRTKTELRASEQRMKLERQFSSERAHQERITNTRRTVYLDLIDELSNTQHFISSLASSKEPPDARLGLNGLSIAVSKIGLVGEMETLVMARELLISVNQTLVKAAPMSLQAIIQRAVQEEQTKLSKMAKEEVARIQVEIANHKKISNADTGTLKELQADLDAAKARSSTYSSGLMEATQALFNVQMLYVSMTSVEAYKLNRKLDDLIYAIRTELGLETSLERLRQSTSALEEANTATTDELTEFGSSIVKATGNIIFPQGNGSADPSG